MLERFKIPSPITTSLFLSPPPPPPPPPLQAATPPLLSSFSLSNIFILPSLPRESKSKHSSSITHHKKKHKQTKERMLKLFLLFFLSLSVLPFISCSDDYESFVYAGCSETKYTPGSPYQLNVESLLTSLSKAAESSTYANDTSSASSADPAYGLFQCRADLPISDCDSCIRSALSQLSALCPAATGGGVQLRSCFLRYDKESFIGKPDNTLLYKRCGGAAAGGYASNIFGMRDAALGSLTTAPPTGGSYRVGGAGYVQAMAQCVGDLSPQECSDCVESAVAQVKAACGFAVGADVYLGKCYLQYWSNGAYPSRHDHVDETGKTLAIIIGILAAVALILVFLSFIRRAGSRGKH